MLLSRWMITTGCPYQYGRVVWGFVVELAFPAYVSSIHANADLIEKLLPNTSVGTFRTLRLELQDELERNIGHLLNDDIRKQHVIDGAFVTKRLSSMIPSTPMEAAIQKAAMHPMSGRWLEA